MMTLRESAKDWINSRMSPGKISWTENSYSCPFGWAIGFIVIDGAQIEFELKEDLLAFHHEFRNTGLQVEFGLEEDRIAFRHEFGNDL